MTKMPWYWIMCTHYTLTMKALEEIYSGPCQASKYICIIQFTTHTIHKDETTYTHLLVFADGFFSLMPQSITFIWFYDFKHARLKWYTVSIRKKNKKKPHVWSKNRDNSVQSRCRVQLEFILVYWYWMNEQKQNRKINKQDSLNRSFCFASLFGKIHHFESPLCTYIILIGSVAHTFAYLHVITCMHKHIVHNRMATRRPIIFFFFLFFLVLYLCSMMPFTHPHVQSCSNIYDKHCVNGMRVR